MTRAAKGFTACMPALAGNPVILDENPSSLINVDQAPAVTAAQVAKLRKTTNPTSDQVIILKMR
jgi:hypothetical protein